MFHFKVNHLTWKSTWGDTFEVIRKKVQSDAQTHAYMTSIDDIVKNWPDYDWYNTGLNPVRPVSFTAGRMGFFIEGLKKFHSAKFYNFLHLPKR